MSKNKLAEATRFAQEGQISKSIQALMEQVAATGFNYAISSNLATLHLQLSDVPTALTFCAQAITTDPYCHTAYFNRFLCYLSSHSLSAARKELHKALSCLYCLHGFLEENSKSFNRAIIFCQQNAKAYLLRAKLNEGKNNKLAENDYSAAIQYDQNLPDIYQQRALFYRTIGKQKEFQADCITYIKLKKDNASRSELVDNEVVPEDDEEKVIDDTIKEEVKEFEDLLLRVKRRNTSPKSIIKTSQEPSTLSKLPLDSIQSNIKKDDEELLLSDRPEEQQGSTQTIAIRKEQIQFKKKTQQGKNFRQIFEDQNSVELDKQIVKLEQQIQREGGKVAIQMQPEELDVSDPNNFLTQQIEKAINQITVLSGPENISDVKSAKSHSSRVSQPKQLTIQQFNQHHTISLEVVSLEDILNYNKKEISKVVLKYGERICQTSMAKYDWRQEFSFAIIGGLTEVEVTVIEKGSIFRGDSQVGQGSINLLQTHNVKCILGNKDKKVAILYFKVNLL